MKRIISLLLCLVLVCMTLVSCKEDGFGYNGEYDKYISDEERDPIVLDFCIVTGEATQLNAKKTVTASINQFLGAKFNTTLNIHYITAENYEAEVLAAAKGEDTETTYRADIVLVLGEDMFDTLYQENLLADLTRYYDSKKYGLYDAEMFARLNVLMSTKHLITASYVEDKIYTVPNDHVIGEYEFLLVKNDVVEKYYNYSLTEIKTWTDYSSEELVALRERIDADGVFSSADAIKYVTAGKYSDIAAYESEGYVCNIAKYPEVTRAEAFKSAFAIIKDASDDGKPINGSDPAYMERYYRAMEVIYTINTDATLRNYLQFGVQGPNYLLSALDDTTTQVVRNDTGSGVYDMDLSHTGGIFNALFCEELGWTPDVKDSALAQNKDARLPDSND
ncbi:MAG: extracellular solute-binding protein [Clostridia bacterium]|nr:extracellular solute-binding protein [Clostridia bacterium]